MAQDMKSTQQGLRLYHEARDRAAEAESSGQDASALWDQAHKIALQYHIIEVPPEEAIED